MGNNFRLLSSYSPTLFKGAKEGAIMKKILLAIPCMDSVVTDFCASYAQLDRSGFECVQSFLKGSLIYESRNKLATQAIKAGCDYVMWFDSDMIFPVDTLQRLAKHMEDKDIVSGLYFRRQPPFTPVLFKKLNGEDGSWEGYEDYPQELFELDGIGFGCVMVKTEVLVDMAFQEHNWFQPLANFGEDLSFCLRAKKLGYKVWCDPTIKCGHIGHLIVNEDVYKTMR